MNNQEKFEWLHWLLDELATGTIMDTVELETARDFIEDLRDEYIYS